MKALLIGATGLVGGFCLERLLNDNNYTEVIILVRKKIELQHVKLQQIVVTDFSNLNEFESIFSAGHIYCCIGTTIKKAGSQEAFKKVDFDIAVNAAKLGAKNNAQLFSVVSSIGANAKSGNFYLRTKGEMEEAVKASGIHSINIFRPSLLLGNRKEFRFGEKIGEMLAKLFSSLMVGSLKKYKPIQAKKVANAMVTSALNTQPGIKIFESNEIESIF